MPILRGGAQTQAGSNAKAAKASAKAYKQISVGQRSENVIFEVKEGEPASTCRLF
jgi:hypothetical protein